MTDKEIIEIQKKIYNYISSKYPGSQVQTVGWKIEPQYMVFRFRCFIEQLPPAVAEVEIQKWIDKELNVLQDLFNNPTIYVEIEYI